MSAPGTGRGRQQGRPAAAAQRSSGLEKYGYTPGKAINNLKPIPRSVKSKPLPPASPPGERSGTQIRSGGHARRASS